MPNVLVEGAVLQCSHGGTATLANGDDEMKILQNIVRRPNTRGKDWELQALMRVAQRRGLAIESVE